MSEYTRRRRRELEKERVSKLVVEGIIAGFVILMTLVALDVEGFLPSLFGSLNLGAQNLAQLLGNFNLINNQPTPWTDIVHVSLGFGVAVLGYSALTFPSRSGQGRAYITRERTARDRAALTGFILVALALAAVVLTKGFFFDIPYEGTTQVGLLEDFGGYAAGFLFGAFAMLWGEP